MNEYTTEQLRDLLASTGKVLTDKQRSDLADAQQNAADLAAMAMEHDKPQDAELTGLDALLVKIPAFVKVVQDMSDAIIVMVRMLIIFGIPVVLALALYVEAQRVFYGMKLFEVHDDLARIGAWFLVISNVLIELVIQYIYQREGYKPERRKKASLRLFFRRVGYWLGVGEWKPKEHSPARTFEEVLWLVTVGILLLAIGGSMTDALQQLQGNWVQGFRSIATESTALEMVTWSSGFVFAVVVVKVSQALTSYVSVRAVEFGAELIQRADQAANGALDEWLHHRERAIDQARERVEREYLLKYLASKNVSLFQIEDEDNPFGNIHHEPAGSESIRMTQHVNGRGGENIAPSKHNN